MKRLGLGLTAIAAFLFIFSGCDKNSDQGSYGNIKVSITDAPFPIDYIESATVTITKVEVRMVSDTSDASFMTLMEDTVTYDLLQLRNGVLEEMANMEVPAGKYDLIRLYVEEASISIKDHDTYTLKVPSGSQTGIKVFLDPAVTVNGGLTADLLLDFSLDSSFVLQGNMDTPAGIKGFHFKPVIRAVNNTTAGTIAGSVADTSMTMISSAPVWVEADTVVATAYTDTTGYYAIPGVPEGSYTVYATSENYDTVSVENVQVTAGNSITVDFELTPVEEE